MQLGAIQQEFKYFNLLPDDIINDVWKRLPPETRKDFLEVSKRCHQIVYGDFKVWELTSDIKKYFAKGYKKGDQLTPYDYEEFAENTRKILIGGLLTSTVGPAALAVGALGHGIFYVGKHISEHLKNNDIKHYVIVDTLTLVSGLAFPVLASAKLGLVGPLIAYSSFALEGWSVCETAHDAWIFTVVGCIIGLGAVLGSSNPLTMDAAVAGFASGLAYHLLPMSAFLIGQNTTVRKITGCAFGAIFGAKEVLSWGWNLGIPKLKRAIVGS